MTAALHPIPAGEVPANAHPIGCPLTDCESTAGRMWRDAPHKGIPGRHWHSVVENEPGRRFDGETGYRAAHWALTVHMGDAHADMLGSGAERTRILLACHRAATVAAREARGLRSVNRPTTAQCADCRTHLILGDDGWRDEDGTDICQATATLCPNLCHPHADSADPACGICHGRGEVYDTHVPYIDTRTPAGAA